MRRWFAIFLLCLLPLQFSWAAVAAYCGHEGNKPAQHLGHHEHQHAGSHDGHQTTAKTADQGNQAGFDFDCGHCHGTCASVAVPPEPMVPAAGAAPWVASSQDALRTRAQSPPERPQWRVLA